MLRRFWLFFAQAVTVLLALMFIVVTLKPQWLQRQGQLGKQLATPIVALRQVAPGIGGAPATTSYADAAQKAMPAVVNVFSSKDGSLPPDPRAKDPLFRYFFGDRNTRKQQDEPAANLGSGVIVSPEGYILTNQHVVDGADQIEVALADGRTATAKVIGSDPETDLAVLKINMTNLPTITLGRSDQSRVGDVVLAIGNPFGVGQTVTMGIISALGRNHLGINTFENFIQTDAPINPGNSGGALVDVNGNLLGINTAIYSRSGGSLGIGFAIPVSTARTVLESIITSGSVTRGWIGVEPQDVTPEIAESFGLQQKSGAIVAGVLQGGPADKAGIKPGDILVTVNGEEITDTTKLLNTVAQIKPGTPTKVHVVRKGKEFDVNVVIGKRPPPPKQALDDQDSDSE
ncbi:Do family serine endopeptidase [Burkholderia pseudomultivorans]|uniref:2-alkenal reductase n=1 Tax=Burkholderia pseudomultivorans TaxID=1207504 RepID=A0A132E8F6_9BURK|nr:Do family serine endopeptidase [Burkholderia pseudomultivorans]KWF20394.1 2-alkenal reductase [Burkholderia pseudomultivorans]MDR8729880.1 Periplasmic pH-dependent serine endoprotease DegQ [Burkholderia pseudomultivorans]MDR8736192.1 Periplasmic pH-dependent serine endoprotease DegQ [Burkholderia pseudomultivorans]MDR8742452.1 Periplasmic pH-dependent serine endoprotease DegQ [Burkholderia pseudomultivorans]MDR8755535.1 Periplasmic pH-dependent serine endoprotease DegQ [Burkholderia pseudom